MMNSDECDDDADIDGDGKTTQFTTSRSGAKETPPEAGAPAALGVFPIRKDINVSDAPLAH